MAALFKPPAPGDFAELIRRRMQEAGMTDELHYLPEAFALTTAGEQSVRMNLGNLYAEYCAAPVWRRNAVLARYLQMFARLSPAAQPITSEDARAHLLPRIRERILYENMALQGEIEDGKRPEFVYRVMGEHLTLEVVYDRPDSIVSVSKAQLEGWGLTFEDALALAGSNLLGSGANRFKRLQSGLFVSDWRDCYDASRLHLSEVITSLPVKGRPVAMVPNRDVLLITGADDPEGLAAMARKAEEALKLPRPMSGIAFRLDARWVPFLPPPEHPAHAVLHRLAAETMAEQYESQKRLLDALHRKQGHDLFVASLLVIQDRKTQAVRTTAAWTEGVDLLLPRTDQIVFMETAAGGTPQVLGQADWERVEAAAGSLMEPQGQYPERYRVRAFPTPAQMSQINPA